MIRQENETGSITVNDSVYTDIVGTAAANCFGVKGMAARSVKDGLYHLLRMESVGKGVLVTFNPDESISIDLHIVVDNGVNLMEISRSIMNRVKYDVTRLTGVEVRSVNVCVDSMVIG